MSALDLHTHSTFSDGLLTPEALSQLAIRKHVRAMALCDHDTVDGLAPMAQAVQQRAREGASLLLLPGIELSTGHSGLTHVLGYGIDPANPALTEALLQLRRKRQARGEQMVAALREQGIPIPAELLPAADASQAPIGRPHVARALVRMGAVRTMAQAFDRYLTEGKPAFVPLTHITTGDAVALLSQAGAVPVLAHPARLGLAPPMLEAFILSLVPRGLAGVEVFHPSASRQTVRTLEALCRRADLLVTGGSDFHGDRDSRAWLGGLPSGWKRWREDWQALVAALQAAGSPVRLPSEIA